MTRLVKGGGPIYDPTSVAAGVGGGLWTFTYYRGRTGGVSLHPLQRGGQVSAASHAMMSAQAAPAHDGRHIGGSVYPAAKFNMTLPPVVPIAGGPRDGNFQV
jgi:hypothetical protein